MNISCADFSVTVILDMVRGRGRAWGPEARRAANPARGNVCWRQQAERLNQSDDTSPPLRPIICLCLSSSEPLLVSSRKQHALHGTKEVSMFNGWSHNTSRLSDVSLVHCCKRGTWRKYVWYFAVEHAVCLIRPSGASLKAVVLCCLRAKL